MPATKLQAAYAQLREFRVSAAAPAVVTRWEKVATTRWGQYLTNIERAVRSGSSRRHLGCWHRAGSLSP